MAMSKFSESATALPPSMRENPPTTFVSNVKKIDKVYGPEADKSEWIKLEFLMDWDNPASKYSRQFSIFKDRCPEEWIKWVMAFREIENLMLMQESADKTRMFRTLLKGQALSYFQYLDLNTFVQQFVERLNDINRDLLYFPEENPKQLDQDEIIEILDQAKAKFPEWQEAIMNSNIDIFEMSYEESVSYFKCLENLEKIRHTNGPNPSSLPADNNDL
jgi:hypothetical protein